MESGTSGACTCRAPGEDLQNTKNCYNREASEIGFLDEGTGILPSILEASRFVEILICTVFIIHNIYNIVIGGCGTPRRLQYVRQNDTRVTNNESFMRGPRTKALKPACIEKDYHSAFWDPLWDGFDVLSGGPPYIHDI